MHEPDEKVTSRSNPLVKRFRETIAGKEPSLFLIEGIRFLEEALRRKASLEAVIYDPKILEKDRGKALIAALRAAKFRLVQAPGEILDAVSGTESPQGIAALIARPDSGPSLEQILSMEEAPFVLVAAGVSDPGNLGSLIRSADAAGATGVIVAEGAAQPFNPKCVRATMGSILRLPIAENVPVADILSIFKTRGVRMVATDSHAGIDFRDADYSGPVALCLGKEAEGIPDEMRKAASLTVRIRLQHEVESLNVGAAGAILLFEIAERRGRKGS